VRGHYTPMGHIGKGPAYMDADVNNWSLVDEEHIPPSVDQPKYGTTPTPPLGRAGQSMKTPSPPNTTPRKFSPPPSHLLRTTSPQLVHDDSEWVKWDKRNKVDEFGCKIVEGTEIRPPSRHLPIRHFPGNTKSPQKVDPTTVLIRKSSQKHPLLPRVVHATRINTPSPPPRAISPVVSPNNSSQPWATQGGFGVQIVHHAPSNNLSEAALTAFSNQKSKLRTLRPNTLDIPIASAWQGAGRPGSCSYDSSMSVQDGSRESLVLNKLDTVPDADEEEHEEDFDLPIERPSMDTDRPEAGNEGKRPVSRGADGGVEASKTELPVSRPGSRPRSREKRGLTIERLGSLKRPVSASGRIPISWVGSGDPCV